MTTHEAVSPADEASAPPMGKVLVISVGLGIAGALVASLFIFVQTALEHVVWKAVPDALGIGTPWWYVAFVLLVGALLVLLARRLPGGTGASPITGFHFDIGPGAIASVVIAALGTLVFGYVLGPEAPLIACGTAIGGLLMRGRDARTVQLGMLLGGTAAIGAIFGNPLITGFMILEFAALGPLPATALVPVLIALGAGYLVQVGLGPWSGLGSHTLSVQGLPVLTNLTAWDLVGAVIVGVASGVIVLAARAGALRIDRHARKQPTFVLLGAWAVTTIVATAAVVLSGQPYSMILFSGQTAMPALIALTSVSTLLVLLVGKAVLYAVALGGGFRGGPIFPAVTLGVMVGLTVALLVPSFALAGTVTAGMAAAVASMTKLPFTATLLAVLIATSAGPEITALAIIGAVVGLVLRLAADRLFARHGVEDTENIPSVT